MRVFLKNVIIAALERGVASGYHQTIALPKTKRANSEIVVATILTSVWKSLDGIIDFSDDEEGGGAAKPSRPAGFSVGAVSSTTLNPDDDDDDDDEE